MKWKENASYTVEAAWVMGIILSVMMSLIMLSYTMFFQARNRIISKMEEVDVVMLFKQKEVVSDWFLDSKEN